MAARAGIRFSTRGAGRTIGEVKGVGAAFGGLGKKSNTASFGIGRVAYRIYNTLARISMVRRGVTGMSREVREAENKWRGWGRAIGGPFTSVLAGVSKKFAEVRRTIAFYILAIKDYTRWGKKMVGIHQGVTRTKKKEKAEAPVPTKEVVGDVRTARLLGRFAARKPAGAAPPPPPIKPPPTGIIGRFARLGNIYRIVAKAAKILTGAIAALSVVLTAAYIAIGYFSTKIAVRLVKGFANIRETFRKYEIGLSGIIRKQTAVNKIMDFATRYAIKYPAMFEDVVETMQGLASMPTLKPFFRRADEKFLMRIMTIVQGLATLKPTQGVAGARYAVRELVSGDLRSLRKRFEVPSSALMEAGGYSLSEITSEPLKALKAIEAFIKTNVPVEAMAEMAKTIEIQWGNLYDRYRQFVNYVMRSTGAYMAVVNVLLDMNKWLGKVFKSERMKTFADTVGIAMRSLIDSFRKVMRAINWDELIKTGDVKGAIKELIAATYGWLSEWWSQIGKQAVGFIQELYSVLWGVAKPLFKALGGMLMHIFIQAMLDSVKFIASLPGKMIAYAIIGVKGTKKLIANEFKKLFATDEYKKAADLYKKIVGDALEEIKNKVKKGEKVPSWDVDIAGKGLKALVSGYRQAGDAIAKLIEKGKDMRALGALNEKAMKWLKDLRVADSLNRQLDALEGMGESVKHIMTSIAERLPAVASATQWEELLTAMFEGLRKIENKWTDVAEKIRKARKEIAEMTVSLSTTLVGAATNFYSKWESMWRRIPATMKEKVFLPGKFFGKETTFGAAAKKTKGVPNFMEDIVTFLKEKIAATTVGLRGPLIESLMGMYEQMGGLARGRKTRQGYFEKAAGLLPMQFESLVKKAEDEMTVQKDQLTELQNLNLKEKDVVANTRDMLKELRAVTGGVALPEATTKKEEKTVTHAPPRERVHGIFINEYAGEAAY